MRREIFIVAGVWAFLVVLAVHFLQFPGSVPDFNRASGGGVLLDALPAFTPDGIYDRLAGYGEAGRQNYSFRIAIWLNPIHSLQIKPGTCLRYPLYHSIHNQIF